MQTDPQQDLRPMIADYMEKGFLENIIDMFRDDRSLYVLVGELIQDERIRVRIGVTALIEELKRLDPLNVGMALPKLFPLLDHNDAVVRGDALNLIGIIGGAETLQPIEQRLSDPDGNVRLIASEILSGMQT